jgi:ATP synthase F1 gamma subunit
MSQSGVIRLRKDLRTTADLMDLLDVLKRVAASQFQTLDKTRQNLGWTTSERPRAGAPLALEPARPESAWATGPPGAGGDSPGLSLTVVLEEFVRLIPPALCRHPFLASPSAPLGLVIVTSDEGFLGGLNASVIGKALAARAGQPSEVIVLGERGRLYFKDSHEPFTEFPGVGEHVTAAAVERLRDHIVEQFLGRKFGRVLVFHPRARSFTHQEVDSFQLLPFERPSLDRAAGALDPREVILEPSAPPIIEYLLRLWVSRKLHEVFWQSRLSELAARTMHLEGSLQELALQKKKLTLQYFRNVHEVMDTSIRESYAGLLSRKTRGGGGRR